MTFPDPEPIKPVPPQWIPPLPPSAEQQQKPAAPMLAPEPLQEPELPPILPSSELNLLHNRLASLEEALARAREHAASAEAKIKQQDANRLEVESYLKTVSEQLRREKAERDALAEKSNAQGRVAALENRLDEMNRSWLSLIKDALAQTKKAPGGKESAAGESPQVVEDLRRAVMDIKDRIITWEKQQELEQQRTQEKIEAIGRERGALLRALEEQNHTIRQEHIKENLRRETDLDAQIKELSRSLEEMRKSRDHNSQEAQELKNSLAKITSILTTTPKAKDQIIADMEKEKEDLSKALKLRAETLQKYTDDREAVEHNLGESLMALHHQLDEERQKRQSLEMRLLDLEADNVRLKVGFEAAQKTIKDKDDLYAALSLQRDDLARTLLRETEKAREMAAKAREQAEKTTHELHQESETRSRQDLAITQLRDQIAALTSQMTRAIGEKEELQTRYGSWDKEREKLLTALREKDQMLTMLNTTFKNMMG